MTFFDKGTPLPNNIHDEEFDNQEGLRSQDKETTEQFYKANSDQNVQRLELDEIKSSIPSKSINFADGPLGNKIKKENIRVMRGKMFS